MRNSKTALALASMAMVLFSLPAWGGMRIMEVTLYPHSAEVVKEGKINVSKGQTRVRLCTIPKETRGNYRVTLLSTTVSLLGYEAVPIKKDEEIEALKRDVLVLKAEKKAVGLRVKLIEHMIEFMGSGATENKRAPVLIPISKVKEREGKLEQWLARSKVKEREIAKELKEKQERLKALESQKGFLVFAHVKGKGSGIVKVSFVTPRAWWRPVYKAVLTGPGKLSLFMLARCSQKTGENWQGITLRFSATRPGGRLSPPEPSPIWLRPIEPVKMARKSLYRGEAMRTMMAPPAGDNTQFKELQVGGLYTLKGSASLPSGSERRFSIGKWRLHVLETVRKSYPSVDTGVYLQVKALAPPVLLPNGTLQLYQNDVESGSTMLSRVTRGNHLLLSFGKDRLITVKRELAYRYLDEKFGNKVEITNRYRITVVNSHNRTVKVSVTEPFPVSQDERVKVSFCPGYPSPLPTKVDREKGFYTWAFAIAPKGTKAITYCYKVKYPKDLLINHRF